MAPKSAKRQKLSPSVASTPASTTLPKSPTAPIPSIESDAWTPSQTTQLFKSVIQSKPTGMHKHMHMLSIAHAVQSTFPADSPQTSHLRIPGIWEKLGGLYDLEALDEREHSHLEAEWQDDSVKNDEESEGDEMPSYTKFRLLPLEDNGEDDNTASEAEDDALGPTGVPEELQDMMWRRRFIEKADEEVWSDDATDSRPATATSADSRKDVETITKRGKGGVPQRLTRTKNVRRGSKALSTSLASRDGDPATPSTKQDDDDEAEVEDEQEGDAESTAPSGSSPPARATRGAARGKPAKGKDVKPKEPVRGRSMRKR